MKEIDDLLNNLGENYSVDIGAFLATLLQYSIRNGRYMEEVLKNQLELKELIQKGILPEKEAIENALDDQLNLLQKDIESEYYDVLSQLISKNR